MALGSGRGPSLASTSADSIVGAAHHSTATVGSEFGVDVFAGGGGRTDVIVDVQGYVPVE